MCTELTTAVPQLFRHALFSTFVLRYLLKWFWITHFISLELFAWISNKTWYNRWAVVLLLCTKMFQSTRAYVHQISVYIYCLCVRVLVCHQVHHQLSQTTEKLHGEADQRQQLSEEFEQVAAIVCLFLSVLKYVKLLTLSSQCSHQCVSSNSRPRQL